MKPITVLLADDHKIVRQAVRHMLELEPVLQVVGEAENGREAIALAKKLRPDVVLMDIAMPQLSGVEAVRRLLRTVPSTKVIMLSAHDDDAYVKSTAKAGAVGFLLKQTFAREVCRAIREGQKGHTVFSPAITKRLAVLHPKPLARARVGRNKTAGLTMRELEVLQKIADGRTNQRLADELGIGLKTAEKHRSNIMQKLDLHETAGLTRYAISAGIIKSSVRLTIV